MTTTLVGSTFSGTSLDPAATPPYAKAHGAKSRAKMRSTIEVLTLASQSVTGGLNWIIGKLPVGATFSHVTLDTDTSLGSTTVAVGISGSTAKYKAAATFTATDTPTSYGKASGKAQAPLTAEETVLVTFAAADLPSSGTLVAELHWREAL